MTPDRAEGVFSPPAILATRELQAGRPASGVYAVNASTWSRTTGADRRCRGDHGLPRPPGRFRCMPRRSGARWPSDSPPTERRRGISLPFDIGQACVDNVRTNTGRHPV